MNFSLTPLQHKILLLLSESHLKEHFYWTGGTALALLYLQHRQSEDIDLFSDFSFSYSDILPFVEELKKITHLTKSEQRHIYDRYEFTLFNDSRLKLEFMHYDFRPLKKRKLWNGIYTDSLTDMAANKTIAMLTRHEPKDAFDVYFLLRKKKFDPKKLLVLVKKKFGTQFPLSNFWSQALLASQNIRSMKPFMQHSKQQQEKIFNALITYFERGAFNETKKHLLD